MEPIIHETALTDAITLMLQQSLVPKTIINETALTEAKTIIHETVLTESNNVTIIDETALTDAIQAMDVVGWKVGGT